MAAEQRVEVVLWHLVASCGILWHGNFVSTIGFVAPFLPRIIHLRFIRKNSVLRTATEQEVTLH